MTSSIGWLDFDSAARDQSQQLLALFNDPDTRDGLGLGSIRDRHIHHTDAAEIHAAGAVVHKSPNFESVVGL